MNDYEKAVNEIVEQIKSARKEQKVSQKAIAEKLGISQVAYSDMEKGKINFSAARLFQVCDILGIDIINKKTNQLVSFDSNQLTGMLIKQGQDIAEIKELLKKLK